MTKFILRFWGVRGSFPTPYKENLKYGGNTTCVEIETDKGIFILDAGTGIINLGNKIQKDEKFKNINILITHTHKDHIEGLSFFQEIYNPKYTLNVYGSKFFNKDLDEILSNFMRDFYSPVTFKQTASKKNIYTIGSDDLIVKSDLENPVIKNKSYITKKDEVVIKNIKSKFHPIDGVNFYRIEYMNKSIVFATDLESPEDGCEELIEFSKNADILIHDAAYNKDVYTYKKGWGHSTPEMAARNALKSNVNRLYLTHYDPQEREIDIQKKLEFAKKIFKNSYLAYESLEIDILKI